MQRSLLLISHLHTKITLQSHYYKSQSSSAHEHTLRPSPPAFGQRLECDLYTRPKSRSNRLRRATIAIGMWAIILGALTLQSLQPFRGRALWIIGGAARRGSGFRVGHPLKHAPTYIFIRITRNRYVQNYPYYYTGWCPFAQFILRNGRPLRSDTFTMRRNNGPHSVLLFAKFATALFAGWMRNIQVFAFGRVLRKNSLHLTVFRALSSENWFGIQSNAILFYEF